MEHPDRTKIEEYRAKAVQALERATERKDSFVQGSWESIAQSYREMADRLERNIKL